MNKYKIKEKAKRLLEDNKYVRQYLRGEITKEELEKKGIKLKMPV